MSQNNNKSFLEGMKHNIDEEKKKEKITEKPVVQNTFEQGLNITQQIMSGNKVKTPRLLVDPGQCVIWEKHNRAYNLLNEIRCKDLIDQFKETGKQEFPAIVRMLDGQGETKYEIICGARRFWVCQYLGWKYFVEIRNLTDEEAFRLSDIENRAREDISDYERAIDYKKALKDYYQNQVQMAEKLEVSTSWLSRYLDLADLPEEILNAYRDVTEIKTIHARKLKPFLSDTTSNKNNKDSVINKAIEISEHGYTGSRVISELLSAVKIPKTKRIVSKSSHSSINGLVKVEILRKSNKKFEILVDKQESASSNEVLDFVQSVLKEFLSQ
jgi:ParB family chromosome partitioning protein